jgi:hypothetical protein
MVNMYDALCIDACPSGAKYVAPIEATRTDKDSDAHHYLPSVVISDSCIH